MLAAKLRGRDMLLACLRVLCSLAQHPRSIAVAHAVSDARVFELAAGVAADAAASPAVQLAAATCVAALLDGRSDADGDDETLQAAHGALRAILTHSLCAPQQGAVRSRAAVRPLAALLTAQPCLLRDSALFLGATGEMALTRIVACLHTSGNCTDAAAACRCLAAILPCCDGAREAFRPSAHLLLEWLEHSGDISGSPTCDALAALLALSRSPEAVRGALADADATLRLLAFVTSLRADPAAATPAATHARLSTSLAALSNCVLGMRGSCRPLPDAHLSAHPGVAQEPTAALVDHMLRRAVEQWRLHMDARPGMAQEETAAQLSGRQLRAVESWRLQPGALAVLVGCAQDGALGSEARTSAACVLRNLAFGAPLSLKTLMWAALPWSSMQPWLGHTVGCGRSEQALALLRNLLHGGSAALDAAHRRGGADAISLASAAVSASAHAGLPLEARTHALYCCANLASGGEAHKEALVHAGVAPMLHTVLQLWHEGAGEGAQEREAGAAAAWVAHNLATGEAPGAAARARALRCAGVEAALLRSAASESSAFPDARDRARGALAQLRMAGREPEEERRSA